jgi:FkbM family methyltransferase
MPEVSIYSFEPLKNIYDELVKNVSNRPVIRTFNMALGSFIGSSPMNRNDFSPASSIFELTENALGTYSFISHSEIEEIRVSTLDALMDEGSIDVDGSTLIKMDVQGYEGEVIRGGVKALSKAKVVISEVCFVKLYKNQLIFKELNALLDAVGFDLIAVYDVELDGRNGFPVFGDAVYLNRNS